MYKLQPSSRAATHISAILQVGQPALTTVGLRSRRMFETCEKMRIGPEFIHDQDEACVGGQGRRLDNRFAWRCSGGEEEAQNRFNGEVLQSRHLEELHIRPWIRRDKEISRGPIEGRGGSYSHTLSFPRRSLVRRQHISEPSVVGSQLIATLLFGSGAKDHEIG
ncbi:hypothetical protein M9H77_08912 [Catharanthus roseus]|uniref:Uncharacterized protein n=1 Tax=Catharanthus roseus TaxID=4058 RepID=A0ACC0BZ14_CATRO|nr:hypothetical protein M9H77_08912 [Catharanthus roseus]